MASEASAAIDGYIRAVGADRTRLLDIVEEVQHRFGYVSDEMRAHPLGRDAALIGEVIADEQCFVQMTTSFGGGRIVDWVAGEQLPRIC
jgi:hydrogenase maturation factor